jgi:deoxyribodipyrimidine photo-lyase
MQSGTTGINTMRVYNPVKQGLDQDPTGAFIRRFVPELEVVPDAFIHEPWKWSDASSLRYPPPIVDHATAAKSAKNTLYALRKGKEHKEVASKIVTKHGSRKTGPSPAKRKLKAKSEAVQGVQLTLDI